MVTYLPNLLSSIHPLLSPYCTVSSVNLFGNRYSHFRLLHRFTPSFHYSLSFHIFHLEICTVVAYLSFSNGAMLLLTGWIDITIIQCCSLCSLTLRNFRIVSHQIHRFIARFIWSCHKNLCRILFHLFFCFVCMSLLLQSADVQPEKKLVAESIFSTM